MSETMKIVNSGNYIRKGSSFCSITSLTPQSFQYPLCTSNKDEDQGITCQLHNMYSCIPPPHSFAKPLISAIVQPRTQTVYISYLMALSINSINICSLCCLKNTSMTMEYKRVGSVQLTKPALQKGRSYHTHPPVHLC